jgi:RNA polymerase sigma-70 factor (ECF subfamily)
MRILAMNVNPAGRREQHLSPTPSATSLTLLDRVRDHDPRAWNRLVQLYAPLIFRWCRRRQLHSEDAADVSQEVFRTVAVKIAAFRRDRAGDRFRAWLWTITRNKIGDHLRRQERQPVARGGSDAQQRFLEIPEHLSEDESLTDTRSLVHRALDLIRPDFEDRTWQAFWRCAVEGQSPKEIALDMGVTPDAVRVAKSRVLRRLREELPDGEMD